MKGAILIREKQARILVALKDANREWHVSSLAKASGTTYVHTCNFLKECERLGLTTGERHGKSKVVRLTSKGIRASDVMVSLYAIINGGEQQGQKPEQKAEQKPAQPVE